MIRKIKRSIARHNMQMFGQKLFGKYAKKGKDKKGNDLYKSYFAREWRNWL